MNNYDDIINYNYSGSKKHKHMSIYERSAIFSAYQALEGYTDDVKETERLTKTETYLDETKKEEINNKIMYLYNNNLEGEFIYFVKDNKKSGGSYESIRNKIKKIDYINMKLYFIDKTKLLIENITDIKL